MISFTSVKMFNLVHCQYFSFIFILISSLVPCYLALLQPTTSVTNSPQQSATVEGRSIDIFKPFVKSKVHNNNNNNVEVISFTSTLFNETDRPNILQKLGIFSRIKRKNKEQDPMMTSDSIAAPRFSPFVFPPPPTTSMMPGHRTHPPSPFSPFMAAAASTNRAMNYFNPFLLGPLDPYGAMARRMASVAPRPTFPAMASGQIPTYFPLGSMMGTPIMDPNLGAALASTLSNRYTPNPLGPMMGGSGLYGPSIYDDPYDSGLIASAIKRYFKTNRGRNKMRDEMRMPSEYSFDKFEYGYNSPRYEGSYSRKPVNKYREPDFKYKDYDYPTSSKPPQDDPPPMRDSPHSESNDDHRTYDSRSSSSESIVPPPPPPSTMPRYRDRNGAKDSNESYVDMYGWRGPAKPISEASRNQEMDDVRREDNRSVDRFNHESSPPYGSRSNSIPSPPPSTYKDTVNRSDLDAVSSDTNEKGRSIF